MLKYLIRRLLQVIPVVFIITIIVFLSVYASGDPTDILLPPNATLEDKEVMREALGLNEPLPVQYKVFITNALQGDFGRSLKYSAPALDVAMEKLPKSLELAGWSLLVSVIFGIIFGILSALAKDTPFDFIISVFSSLGRSLPNFWMGIMFILLFGVVWRVLPPAGTGTWKHLVMPCLCLSIQQSSRIIPLVRSSMLEIMHEDYIRTANSKGLPRWKVIIKHVFKNTLVSVVTVVALQLPTLVGGSLVTETVFAWPGLGQLIVQSINFHDMAVVQVCVLIVAFITLLSNLFADLFYCVIDPRIRY